MIDTGVDPITLMLLDVDVDDVDDDDADDVDEGLFETVYSLLEWRDDGVGTTLDGEWKNKLGEALRKFLRCAVLPLVLALPLLLLFTLLLLL